MFIEQLESRLAQSEAVKQSVKVNPPENARLTFDQVVNEMVEEMIDSNFKFYKQIRDNEEFGKRLLDWLFDRYLRMAGWGGSG